MSAVSNVLRNVFAHPLARKSRLRALARIADWQVRSRLQSEIEFPWIAGQKLVLRHGMTGATGNLYVGLHEFTDMMFLLHFLRPDDLFLDIGANVGTYTVLASGVRRARTIAFEPDPLAMRALKRNIDVNRLGGQVTAYQVALGAAECDVRFTAGRDARNRIANAGERSRLVHQWRLDGLSVNPTFAKIDVEGYEKQVLQGAPEMLANPSLRVIAVETADPGEISIILHRHGFERFYYEPFTRALTLAQIGFPASNDLFVRDATFVADRVASSPKIDVLGYQI